MFLYDDNMQISFVIQSPFPFHLPFYYFQVGSLAGAALVLNSNIRVQRMAQREQKSLVE